MEIRAVRIGNRYDERYEDYLKLRLPEIKFLNENKEGLWYQWNKIHFFNLDIDEPVCVIDIDLELMNDYMDIFNYPIERGEFLTMRQHWDPNSKAILNGGFYKFYPKDTKYIYERMMEAPEYWMRYFIDIGVKPGPFNGEENFVEMVASERLKIKYIPDNWCSRNTTADYANKELRLVHYTGLDNLKHFIHD